MASKRKGPRGPGESGRGPRDERGCIGETLAVSVLERLPCFGCPSFPRKEQVSPEVVAESKGHCKENGLLGACAHVRVRSESGISEADTSQRG